MGEEKGRAGGRGGWQREWWVLLLAAAVVMLWNAIFVVTGLVGQPPPPPKVARPSAVSLPQPDTGWVDLDAWRRNHPTWTPEP